MLELSGITKGFGSIQALSDVSLSIAAGEIVALVGENGAGKSTLVRCVARDTLPDSGKVAVDGRELGRSPRDAIQEGVSVVWQDLALCENLDVTANLFLGRELATHGGLARAAMHSKAQRVFEDLNVAVPGVDRPIERLSGGQRQLVAIARATLDRPKVLVLDEPTAALGIAESRSVLGVVKTLQSYGVAILLVSHQLDKVFDVADRIVVLRHGRLVGDLHRAEAHPDDVVALITGADVDTTAGKQLRRLHSLAEQLADADASSVLPLTVTSLSNALSVDRLAIFLTEERPDGSVLRCSASLNLPARLEAAIGEVPVGRHGGFLGSAAAESTLVVVPQLRDRRGDQVAGVAQASGLAGAWAAPIAGPAGTLAVIVGFTDAVAQLQDEQIQLLELFSTMAGAAIERGRLVESLRTQNRSLVGLRDVLETLAGPEFLQSGMTAALDALRRGIACDFASLMLSGPDGVHEERASSTVDDDGLASTARDSIRRRLLGGPSEPANVTVTPFEWSRGSAALACVWSDGVPSEEARQVLAGAANSFRLAMERELKHEAEQDAEALRKSRAMERELTRRFGHELRTPLTAIRGFASTMLQPDVEWSDEDKQRFLRIIESESGRVGRLVAQLFDDSAIGSGTLRLSRHYCDLVAIIEQAVSIAGPGTGDVVGMPETFSIWGDQDRIEQVFVNLIDNAFRHNRQGTTVEVSMVDLDRAGQVVVAVSDSGVGLPPDVIDFLNGGRDELNQASGLGLRLARGLVRAHGGSIVAANADGARIEISLPIEPEPEMD